TQRRRPWIQHSAALFTELGVTGLTSRVGVVAHLEIPLHRRVLTRKGMEAGDLVIVRETRRTRLERVASRFQEEHQLSRVPQASRQRCSPGTRTDDHIVPLRCVGVGHWYAVSERLEKLDQRTLVLIVQYGLLSEGLLVLAQVLLIVEFRSAEVVAFVDDEI